MAEIAKDITAAHYSGWRTWDSFALIEPGVNAAPTLRPVRFESAGERDIDDQDYIHQEYRIVAGAALVPGAVPGNAVEVIESFTTRIDGRA